ncbi:MAG: hypothetical protein U5K27_02070 [Desulfotignum sp.]|nr:hypothetical protein [Desulfotignum sp.]
MGELIARAVHEGVTRAVFLQNGLTPAVPFSSAWRNGASLYTLTDGVDCQCSFHPGPTLTGELQSLLMTPRYAGMVEQAPSCSPMHRKKGRSPT